MKEKRSSFSGSIGFVLAAAGSAVGVGNIWRFPYLCAKDGGGLFLLVYLVLVLTFGFVLLTTDVAIGRKTKKNALKAFEELNPKWKFLGRLTFLVPVLIMTYYSVIGGWITKYLFVYLVSDGIEAAATVDSAEVTAAGETASDVTGGDAASTGTAEDTNKTAPTPAPAPRKELTTADRMVDRTKVKGIYVTGPKAGSAGMEELIGLVDETELNAMVIDVKNDEGNVTFRLTNAEITQNIPVLDQISEMQAGVRYIRDIQAPLLGFRCI